MQYKCDTCGHIHIANSIGTDLSGVSIPDGGWRCHNLENVVCKGRYVPIPPKDKSLGILGGVL